MVCLCLFSPLCSFVLFLSIISRRLCVVQQVLSSYLLQKINEGICHHYYHSPVTPILPQICLWSGLLTGLSLHSSYMCSMTTLPKAPASHVHSTWGNMLIPPYAFKKFFLCISVYNLGEHLLEHLSCCSE